MKRFLTLAVLAIGGLVGTCSVASAHGHYGGFRSYGGYRSYGGGYGGGCHSSYYRPSYGGYSSYGGYGYGGGYSVPVYSYPSYGYGGYGVPVYGSGFQVYTPGISVGVWR